MTIGQVGGKECKNNKICLRPLWIVYIGVVFKVIMLATATHDSHYCTCLGLLGHCDKDTIISIGQGKYVRCDIAWDITLNIANVNTA